MCFKKQQWRLVKNFLITSNLKSYQTVGGFYYWSHVTDDVYCNQIMPFLLHQTIYIIKRRVDYQDDDDPPVIRVLAQFTFTGFDKLVQVNSDTKSARIHEEVVKIYYSGSLN